MSLAEDKRDFSDYLEKSRLDPDGKSDIIWLKGYVEKQDPQDKAKDLKKRRKKLRKKR